MAICCCFVFSLLYNFITIGYPSYQIVQMLKQNKTEKIWVAYFLLLGAFTLLESTILFPVKYLLCLICCKSWKTIKMLFCLWSYYPTYRGALLIDQIAGKYIELAYNMIFPVAGKFLSMAGYPVRSIVDAEKKQQ